jgi:hypothetical protein
MANPPPLEPSIFTLLREGATLAVVLIVIAFVLSRFTRDIVGRFLLIIFLFIAAGAYFGFTYLEGPGIWTLAALVLDCCRMGVASPLGRRAVLHRTGILSCSYNLL